VALLKNIAADAVAVAATVVVYFQDFICEKEMHFFRPFFSLFKCQPDDLL